jgi:DNA-binding MarR family transcriptional regulator
MIERLKDKIGKRDEFESIEQEVHLMLMHVADAVARPFDELFKGSGLSPTQYNVLRILRGAGPEGLPCSAIGQRMITRDPDMTRLLDRLEKQKLIVRRRDPADRRVVKARIAPAGLILLEALDLPVRKLHVKQLAHLSRQQLKELLGLLNEVMP